MARIKTYGEVNQPSLDDILIGTAVNESDATKNFKIEDILNLGSGYVLPVASTVTLGGVKIDGTTIGITDGVISALSPSLLEPIQPLNSYFGNRLTPKSPNTNGFYVESASNSASGVLINSTNNTGNTAIAGFRATINGDPFGEGVYIGIQNNGYYAPWLRAHGLITAKDLNIMVGDNTGTITFSQGNTATNQLTEGQQDKVLVFNTDRSIVAPSLTISRINAEPTGKSLVTKEWAYKNVGGLYAQTALGSEVRFVDGETNLIGSGVGVLTVPANSFQVGDSFVAKMCGNITCSNNQQIRLRVDTNGVLLIDTGTFELSSTTNKVFDLVTDFTITKIGGNGVAEIFANASFTHNQDSSNTMIGYNVNNINGATFDTTINNTLTITAEWIDNNAANVIQSQNFTLKRVY